MIDLTKPVQTRDGREATIIATGLRNGEARHLSLSTGQYAGQSVAARVGNQINCYDTCGFFREPGMGTSGDDLVNIPEGPVVTERFFSIYPENGKMVERAADSSVVVMNTRPGSRPISSPIVKITYEDGVAVSREFIG